MIKPYAFVPINKEVRKKKIVGRERMLKDRCHGKLSLRITALTPLLVASGEFNLVNGQLVNGLVLRNGVPVIPGSTVKGMARTMTEIFSYSCHFSSSKPGEIPFDQHLPPENKGPCRDLEHPATEVHACPACRMYGYTMNKKVCKGLLDFSEFTLEGDPQKMLTTSRIPLLYGPLGDKRALHSYLDEEDYMQKKLYKHGKPQTHTGAPYQVLKAGASFQGEVAFFNLEEEELALFVLALGASTGSRRFQGKLGYGKPAFFGSVQIDVTNLQTYKRPFLPNNKSIDRDALMDVVEAYGMNDPFLTEQINRVVTHLQYEPNKHQVWGRDAHGQVGY